MSAATRDLDSDSRKLFLGTTKIIRGNHGKSNGDGRGLPQAGDWVKLQALKYRDLGRFPGVLSRFSLLTS